MMQLGARAYVTNDFRRNLVVIHLGHNRSDGSTAALSFPGGSVISVTPVGAAPSADDYAPLMLPDDIARALLQALAQHYGAAPEVLTVRQDLDAERRRTDKLIDTVSKIALGMPEVSR